MYLEGLDELDQKILDVIHENARLTYSEIGEKVNISRVSVKKRMESMEENGIIQGYKTVINPTKVPGGIAFILDLETTPNCYEDVIEGLSQTAYVRKILAVSGECAIHAEGYISNPRSLETFANTIYREARHGIRKISCKTVLSTIMDIDGGVEYERYQKPEHLEK